MNFLKRIFLISFYIGITLSLSAQSLLGPESVVFDQANSRYLISNSNGTSIIARDMQGNLTTFVDQGLFFPRGMAIVGNMLFVTDIGKIMGYDLTTKALMVDSIIQDAQGLNDITYDGKGNLFLSDDLLNKVYLYNVTYGTSTTLIEKGLSAPNGLLYDTDKDHLIICSFDGANAAIWRYDINTFILSTAKSTTLSYLDGLAMDVDKNIYVSSWGDNSVHKFSYDFSTGPEVFSSGHNGPADIYINPTNNTLVVPNMNSNTLDFIKIIPASIQGPKAGKDISVSYSVNNASVVLSYELNHASWVRVELIDGLARTVNSLLNDNKPAGKYTITLDRKELGIKTGVYVVRFWIDGKPRAVRLFLQ